MLCEHELLNRSWHPRPGLEKQGPPSINAEIHLGTKMDVRAPVIRRCPSSFPHCCDNSAPPTPGVAKVAFPRAHQPQQRTFPGRPGEE
jgi:hypothetical protein